MFFSNGNFPKCRFWRRRVIGPNHSRVYRIYSDFWSHPESPHGNTTQIFGLIRSPLTVTLERSGHPLGFFCLLTSSFFRKLGQDTCRSRTKWWKHYFNTVPRDGRWGMELNIRGESKLGWHKGHTLTVSFSNKSIVPGDGPAVECCMDPNISPPGMWHTNTLVEWYSALSSYIKILPSTYQHDTFSKMWLFEKRVRNWKKKQSIHSSFS